jgi:hypothetical protein
MLTFDVDPETLTADDITITGATKGALSGSGTTRTIGISDIVVDDGETVSVAVTSPDGFAVTGSPQYAVVYRADITGPAKISLGGLSVNDTETTFTWTDPSDVDFDQLEVTCSFYDSETTRMNDTGKGAPKTTAEMQTESTFTAAGWGFAGETGYWDMDSLINDGYPYLTWLLESY